MCSIPTSDSELLQFISHRVRNFAIDFGSFWAASPSADIRGLTPEESLDLRDIIDDYYDEGDALRASCSCCSCCSLI